jgi:integrase/recombinase XerD
MCLTEYDSVAQLGERHLDRVEVAGSSPVGIIIGEGRKSY